MLHKNIETLKHPILKGIGPF